MLADVICFRKHAIFVGAFGIDCGSRGRIWCCSAFTGGYTQSVVQILLESKAGVAATDSVAVARVVVQRGTGSHQSPSCRTRDEPAGTRKYCAS